MITMSGRFDLERYCQLVEKYRPDRSHLVPPIILMLAKNPVVDKYDVSSVKMIVSAAAPLSDHIEKGVFDRVGSRVKQAWGMSELSPIATFQTDDAFKSGSIGTVTASTEGKVVDLKTGCTVGPGVQGELMIKVSPHLTSFPLSRNDIFTQISTYVSGTSSNAWLSWRPRENCRMSQRRWVVEDWRYM